MTTTDLDYDTVFAGLREQIGAEVAEQFDALVARLRAEVTAANGHTMTPEKFAELRAVFPPEAVGKLPRVSCRQCSDAQTKVCNNHTKQKCEVCDNYMTTQHVHLDYVGHAAVTDRLLHVDPLWSWEPVAIDPQGLPMISRGEKMSRMWIRLTICGVTRLGVGIAESWKGEMEKELIGDALRNAAMRFGVALDLWSKEDLRAIADAEAHGPPAAARQAQAAAEGGVPQPADPEVVKATSARIDTLSTEQKAAVQAFVTEMGASWPWPKAVCVAINRRIDDLLGQVSGDPDTPPAPEPPRSHQEAMEADSPPPTPLPPPDDLPVDGPCELCGSTRAAKAIVHGVRRCQNATDCKKRQEAKEEAEREGTTTPLPDGAAAREAESGNEDLFCAGCNERIVGELPVFGEHEEAYHVACSPAFIGES